MFVILIVSLLVSLYVFCFFGFFFCFFFCLFVCLFEHFKIAYQLIVSIFVNLFQLMEAGVIGQNMANVQRLVEREPKLVHMSVTILPRNMTVTIVMEAQRNPELVK